MAGVGGKLVDAHDAVARSLGEAAKPMLIGAPSTSVTPCDGTTNLAVRHREYRPSAGGMAEMANIDFGRATSVDLDGDGIISLDEILALGRSGLNDAEVLERLEHTGRTFDLSTSQEQYLSECGVSDEMIARLRTLHRPTVTSPAGTATASGSRISDSEAVALT